MDEAAWADAERLIGEALQGRAPRIATQLRLFIRATNLVAFLRFLRPFAALSTEGRTRVLRSLESSRLLIVRRGFWGLRTLVYLGYYGRESVWAQLGYRASPSGWSDPERSDPRR